MASKEKLHKFKLISTFDPRLLSLEGGAFEKTGIRIRDLFREGDFYGVYGRITESGSFEKIYYFRDEYSDEYFLRQCGENPFEFYNLNSQTLLDLSRYDEEDLINREFSSSNSNYFSLLYRPQTIRILTDKTLGISKVDSVPILGLEFDPKPKWDLLEDKLLEYRAIVEFSNASFRQIKEGFFSSFIS